MSAPQAHLESLPRSVQLLMALGLIALIAFPSLDKISTRKWSPA
jgi:hypothetical protein